MLDIENYIEHMGRKSEIQEGGSVVIPELIRADLEIDVGDKIEWKIGEDYAIIEPVTEGANEGMGRRIVLENLLQGSITLLAGRGTTMVDDDLTEIPSGTEPIGEKAKQLLNFDDKLALVTGRGAPEISDLGEIDLRAQAHLASFISNTVRGDTQEVKYINKQDVRHLATTAGPIGSDLVALSMGYNPVSLGEYSGGLPYIFDLSPSEEYTGLTLDEIREFRTNWPIVRTKGDEWVFTPKPTKDGSTLGDSDRPKYRTDYGIMTVKQISEGWEQYDRMDEFSDLSNRTDNLHMIISGCHGEGTLATTMALTNSNILSEILNALPPNPRKYQVVIKADIGGYEKRYDREGEPFHLPNFDDISLIAAEPIPD